MLFIFLLAVASSSCHDRKDDFVTEKPAIKVLILGNSIVKHAPEPSIGWNGDWGMAASSKEKDFVSVFTEHVKKSNYFKSVVIDSENIAFWENDFNYDLNQLIDISKRDYDILIVRLGENVAAVEGYEVALNKMINHFKNINTTTIITGLVWYNQSKEDIHKKVAKENGYKYISLSAFRNQQNNYSYGLFEDTGVAAHPSDLGMIALADSLYQSVLDLRLAR